MTYHADEARREQDRMAQEIYAGVALLNERISQARDAGIFVSVRATLGYDGFKTVETVMDIPCRMPVGNRAAVAKATYEAHLAGLLVRHGAREAM